MRLLRPTSPPTSSLPEETFDAGAATADDTDRINALLTRARQAGAGRVRGRPGENYQISKLVIGSGTTLDMTGCVVTQIAGANTNMVTNYSALNPVASAADAAVTAGSNVVTTALAAQAAVGQTITVTGAASNGYGPLIGNVAAKTSTTVTLVKLDGTPANATAAVTAAAVELSTRDQYLAVLGGDWRRGANGPNGAPGLPAKGSVPGHSIYLKHVDNFRVDIDRATSGAGVTFVWPTDVSNFQISVRDADVVRTVCQVVGPAYKGQLPFIAGKCTDDLINLCGNVYPDQTETSGDVRSITIGNVHARNVGASALKLNAGQGNFVEDVRVTGGIYGSAQIGVFIGEDKAYPETTGGTYGAIDLGHIDCSVTNQVLFTTGAQARSITARVRAVTPMPILLQGSTAATIGVLDLTLDAIGPVNGPVRVLDATIIGTLRLAGVAVGDTDGKDIVQVYGTSRVKNLILDGFDTDFAHTNGAVVRVSGTATVDAVTMRNVRASWPDTLGTSRAVYCAGAGATLRRVAFLGGVYTLGRDLVRVDTGAVGPVTVALTGGILLAGIGRILNTRVSTDLSVEQTEAASCVDALVYTSGAPVRCHGGGPRVTGTSSGLYDRAAAEIITGWSGSPAPAGNYFFPLSQDGSSTGGPGSNTLRVAAWPVTRTTRLDRLGVEIATAGESGAVMRLGVWADNGAGLPGPLVLDVGTVAADSTGHKLATIDLILPPGLYWIGGAAQAAATTQPVPRTLAATTRPPFPVPLGTSTPAASASIQGVFAAGQSGAFGASFPTISGTTALVPRLLARAA